MNVEPITVNDIMFFVQNVVLGFSDSLFLSFTLMITISVCLGIRRIMVGVKQ